jgi:hypothetical protein
MFDSLLLLDRSLSKSIFRFCVAIEPLSLYRHEIPSTIRIDVGFCLLLEHAWSTLSCVYICVCDETQTSSIVDTWCIERKRLIWVYWRIWGCATSTRNEPSRHLDFHHLRNETEHRIDHSKWDHFSSYGGWEEGNDDLCLVQFHWCFSFRLSVILSSVVRVL